MKKNLLIIGAGEHAKVVIENVLEQNKYKIVGMINFNHSEKKNQYFGVKVVCNIKQLDQFINKFNQTSKINFILGVGTVRGNMSIREKIYKQIEKKLFPVNVINPKAHISQFAKIGKGNLIEAFAKVSAGAKLGNNCVIESFSGIHHDQKIGNNVFIATNVAFAGSSIGDNCLICDGVSIGFKKNIGKNSIILDGTRINKNVPADSVCYEQKNNIKKISLKNYKKISQK